MKAKRIILAVGAHPDDIDTVCGGTVAKFISEGADVYYLILTDGSKGHEDYQIPCEQLIGCRRKEQEKSGQVLGLNKIIFFDYVDGELENNTELTKKIVSVIREIKPSTIITLDPTFVYDCERGRINHPDHRIAGQATLDAVFPFSRNSRTYPELLEQGLEPHTVSEILLGNCLNGNFYVDITLQLEKKLKALENHQSQFKDMEAFIERVRKSAEDEGKKAGVECAECFGRIDMTLQASRPSKNQQPF